MTRWKPDAAGRLVQASLELFAEQGYEATTVAEIAERAGLTKRTFFRHFADKKEVLFVGSDDFEGTWLSGMREAPDGLAPLDLACAGANAIAELFVGRHAFARLRSQIIDENPELFERELIKLQRLATATKRELIARGSSEDTAVLAAQMAVTVFHVAFRRWVAQDDPTAFAPLVAAAREGLAEVAAGAAATSFA